MELMVATPEVGTRLVLRDFSLDLEVGPDTDNDFELQCGERLHGGETIWCPGTEWGGVVDDDKPSHGPDGDSMAYHGRTWSGVLQQNVLQPDSGQSHLTVSGDCNAVLGQLLQRCGLVGPFRASQDATEQVSYQFPRYCTLYEGVVAMLASVGRRLSMVADDGVVVVSAVPVVDWGEYASFEATRGYRPVNHLVVLGSGEMQQRQVVNLYADEAGAISKTQTLFGMDHRAEVYELSNESGSELESDGRKKLQEYQEHRDEVEVEVDVIEGMAVGDVATCDLPEYGAGASATVTGITVEYKDSRLSVTAKSAGELTAEGYE